MLNPTSFFHPAELILLHTIQQIKQIKIKKPLLSALLFTLLSGAFWSAQATTVTFTGGELLGKPTDTSVAINIVPASTIEYYYEYGTASGGPYPMQTSPLTAAGGSPHEIEITGLTPNTRYYYRMIYDGDGDVADGDYEVRSERTFHTQRAEGETFVFTVTSDSHAQLNSSNFQQAMQNVLSDLPDFTVDLGDTFYPSSGSSSQSAVNQSYLAYRNSLYFGAIGHSIPIFLTAGNHEEEEGWNLDDTPFSIGLASIQARKAYYPTPVDMGPGGFYTGNTDPLTTIDAATYGDQLREDYYAWTWGDALFVVLDEFQYTMDLPYTPTAGEGSNDSVTGDQWSWTLGEQQFNWLKNILEENKGKKYKFVFSHNMTGGILSSVAGVGPGYVRGGAGAAPYFEWGGKNADGSWGFDTHRPGWGGVPTHQLLVENGVSAYFHGHDHQYVYESLDGVVYQEVPSPSMTGSGFSGIYSESNSYTHEMLPNSGHLRITVTPTVATVEYVRSNQTGVSHTYTIAPNPISSGPGIGISDLPLSPFNSAPETPSEEQNFSVSGSGLTDDITITAPADFEISSASGSDFSASLTLPESGGSVAATDIFVRFNRATEGTSSGNISLSSLDASTQNVAVSGTAAMQFSMPGEVTLDGAVSSGTADGVASVQVSHATGTGTDRLMLVGISANSYNGAQTISSVTFTPEGEGAIALSEVGSIENEAGRLAAIYSLLDPPSGVSGTVSVTFSGSVANGFVVGAANFAGVDQSTPLDAFASAVGTEAAAIHLDVPADAGDIVFDTVFLGAATLPTLAADGSQSQLWNGSIDRVRGAASTKEAIGSPVSLDWTASGGASAYYWAIGAVPINPAAVGTAYDLTMAVAPDGSGTTDPAVGTHAYAEGTVVDISATAVSGYVFDHWEGDVADVNAASTTVTMDASKTVTAHFVESAFADIILDGEVSSGTADGVASVQVSHATGTGTDRLMLVGISANSYNGAQTISSVTFTPDGEGAIPLSEVGSIENEAGRLAAIYSLLDPPSGVSGAVSVTFSGSVANGIVVGAANFAGVDQSNPFDDFVNATGTQATAINLNVPADNGDIVFDTVFLGAATLPTLAADGSQSQLWNGSINRARGAASTKEATGSPVSLDWTASGGASTYYWAIGAVPINPAAAATTHDLTMAVTPDGSGTTDPAVGTHAYAEGTVVDISATAVSGYVFDHWEGDVADVNATSTTVTMDEDQAVTAVFTAQNFELIMAVDGFGTTDPAVGTHAYASGTVVDITATPAQGYVFDHWTGDVADANAASTTVTMDEDQSVTAYFTESVIPGEVTLDGTVSSGTADGVASVQVSHTTGTGTDRLMLVGISANSYNGAQTISSVTFTPEGEGAIALSEVGSIENEAGRLAAIYSLVNPPSGVSGTVSVTFSGSVANGFVVGAANFAGVDQSTPLDAFASAVGTEAAAIHLDVPADAGDIVFDTVFLGAATLPTLAADGSQSQLWNGSIDRVRGAASTKEAIGSPVSLGWTASGGASAYYWAIGAVPINPAAVGTAYDLTMAVTPDGSGTTDPAVGVHTYAEGTVVDISATAVSSYVFDHWEGDVADVNAASTTVTMDASKTVTAHFVESAFADIILDGEVSSGTADGVASVQVSHATGTGTDRLMLVGISANSYNGAQTISSVTFTPEGEGAIALSEVGSIENEAGRLAAIYSLLDPPSGLSGTVAVTFSGSVDNGIVVGAANFAGVDQSNPFDDFVNATGTQATAINLNVPADNGDVVFDTVFLGAATLPALAADGSQSQLWNGSINRARGAASTKEATGSPVNLDWTASGGASAYYWAIGAVPINPAAVATNHDLTMAVTPAESGTTDPAAGVHTYAEGTVVDISATAVSGYVFDHWEGDVADVNATSTTVTMDASKTVTAHFVESAFADIILDGEVSSGTADGVASVQVSHATGTGTDRLMLVGISANSYNGAQTISSVTFTPEGEGVIALSEVGSIENEAGRLAAIYSLLDPPSGVSGTVEVTFSGSVDNGIVVGAANFAGVDQSTPLDAFASAVGTEAAAIHLDVPADAGDIVFDTVFLGAATLPSLTAGGSQTQLWNGTLDRARGVASSQEATGSLVSMDWTASGGASAYYWAIGAVPINPAAVGTAYDLTMAVTPAESGTTDPAVGVHTYASSTVVDISATPAQGYVFDHWTGNVADANATSTTVTMDASKTVTAHFIDSGSIPITFTGREQLGKPTDNSIAINIVPDATIEYYYEYGTSEGGPYTTQTPPVIASGGFPNEVVLTGLIPNTRYYYRMIYDGDGDVEDGSYEVRSEGTFHTQRAQGETFVFTVTSDSHANFNENLQQAMQNVLNDLPDLYFDLGDTFMPDGTTSQYAVNQDYLAYRSELYFGAFGHSVPIFLSAGNHEDEEGWNLDDTPFSIGVANIQARKAYFPTPVDMGPGGFYTGDTNPLAAIDETTYGDEFREDYYAFEWGDALFVVITPFQYTMQLPYAPAAGEGSDDLQTGDQWSWTLGEQQFNWFKETIQGSDARYKFVFSHQMTGGIPNLPVVGVGPGYVRGGAGAAPYFEWGGQDGNNLWKFADMRDESAFGTMPIHQIMAGNGVSAYFHGHDHQFVYEKLDGVVYQEVPTPSWGGSGFDGIYDEANSYTIKKLPNTGHLRLTVGTTETTVEYIDSGNSTVKYTYSIEPNDTSTEGYAIAATAGSHGSISAPGISTYGTVTVSAGGDTTFAITPDSGYQVADVLVDGLSVGVVTSYEFTDVQADHTIEARFTESEDPVISITGDLTAFSSEPGTPSAEQSYTVSGSNLIDDIVIAAPADFEISEISGGGFGSSLTLTPSSGAVSATSIFVRFNRDTEGTSSGSITHTSTDAPPQNVTVSGTATTYIPGEITLDGAVSSDTADGASSIQVTHTTGTGADRLMLVGVSSNSYNNARTISSVTFTPEGEGAIALSEVGSIENEAGRLAAIYSLLDPPSGVSGTVSVTFSGSVSYGIVVGVANFAGVDQSNPLDAFTSAVGTETSAISLGVPADAGDIVFDTVFLGAATLPALTAGGSQTQLWNGTLDRARGVASSQEATGSLVSMDWTASGGSSEYFWAIGAVPINPAAGVTPQMPSHTIVLGRPTNNSITVNAVLEQGGEVAFEYGTVSGVYDTTTTEAPCTAGQPVEVVIDALDSSTEYFYRMLYRSTSVAEWISGDEHSFRTQRYQEETFTFTIASDSHLGDTFSGNSPLRYEQATLNIAGDNPDFHLDLGDAFIMNAPENQAEADAVYLAQRPYFGNFSHSAPVFLAIGNHENEEGWNLDDLPFSKALGSITARKKYYPNPIPDAFYSGNSDPLPQIGGDGLREDYYAWEWGDALFIVLDPFQYTMTKPYGTVTGSGEDDDEAVIGDQWNWTLGEGQYNWFKQTLETSNATFKFVFAHHIVGGQVDVSNPMAGPPEYVRGGGMAAPYFEWGGLNADDTWGFDTERGWDNPIHQLMLDNGVNAFFHGHDHQFAHEEIDGIVYQLVPSTSMTGYGFDLYDDSPYVISGGNLPNAGHLRVTVSQDDAQVEYVRSAISGDSVTNGEVTYSYVITLPENQPPTADAGPDQTVTDTDDNGSENVTLNGTGSSDTDGSIASYVWTEGGSEIATGASPTVSFAVGAHTVTLTVTDDDAAIDTDEVVITVNEAPNVPPTADAGDDQTVEDSDDNGSEEVTLDGAGSTDSDGVLVSYVWSENSTQIATGVNATVSFDVGVHTVTLMVEDNEGATDTDTVTITVNEAPNVPPSADAGPDQTVEDSDDSGEELVTLDGSGSEDIDGSIDSYSWSENGTVIASDEITAHSFTVGVHTVTLTVEDNEGATGTDTVTITVNAAPPNEPPTADAGPNQTVIDDDDNGSEHVTLVGSGSQDLDGSITSYTWTEGIEEIATGVNPTVDFTVGVHTVTLTVTDDDGATGTDTVMITVNSGSQPQGLMFPIKTKNGKTVIIYLE